MFKHFQTFQIEYIYTYLDIINHFKHLKHILLFYFFEKLSNSIYN